MNKPNILMMPSWYPTKENPLSGSFFKEQATELAKDFNFVVLLYSAESLRFRSLLKRWFEKRLVEFSIDNYDTLLPELTFRRVTLLPNGIIFKILNKIGILNKIKNRIESHAFKEFLNFLYVEVQFKPDLLYAMTAQVNAPDAARLAHLLKIPYVLAEHSPFPFPGHTITAEIKCAIENAGKVLAISRDKTRQMIMQNVNVSPVLVGNMVDEDIFVLPKNKKNGGVFTILIVAAYNIYKDYPTFFKAMQKLRTIAKNKFRILIVGFNPVIGKSIWNLGAEEFMQLAKSYNLLDICTLVEKAERNEMVNYYHEADVFVMTSIQEGFPVSSIEATSCGLPVYATRCGGVDDFIDDENGRLFNIQDSESIALELKKLVDGEVYFNSERIRQKTVTLYGKDAFRKRLSNIFMEVINASLSNN